MTDTSLPQRRSTKPFALTWSVARTADALQAQLKLLHRSGLDSVQQVLDERQGTDPESVYALALLLGVQEVWKSLDESRFVLVDPEQVLALPALSDDEEFALAREAHAPFPVTYFDFAGDAGAGIAIEATTNSGKSIQARMLGAVVRDDEHALEIAPVLREPAPLPDGFQFNVPGWAVFPRSDDPPSLVKPFQVVRVDSHRHAVGGLAHANSTLRGSLETAAGLAEHVLRVLMLLESVNVTVAERELALSARKRALRTRQRVPHVLVIARPRSEPGRQQDGASGRTVKIRYEVRGFYRHYGPETPIGAANPTKLRNVPEKGFCVRVWTPPHVRGPVDQPLKIRVRKIAPQPE